MHARQLGRVQQLRRRIAEVAKQACARLGTQLCLVSIVGMANAQAHPGSGFEAFDLFGAQREAQIVDRRDPVLFELVRVEVSGHPPFVLRPGVDDQRDVLVDPDQPIQLASNLIELGNLDEERRRQLVLSGNQIVGASRSGARFGS